MWDATCVYTLADSYIKATIKKAGNAAEIAAKRKHNKYKEKNFIILPLAVETLGPWGIEAIAKISVYPSNMATHACRNGIVSFSEHKLNEVFYIL